MTDLEKARSSADPGPIVLPPIGSSDSSYWTKIRTPDRAWRDLELRDLWNYRDLIRLFVRRDIVSMYKQTIIGPAWFFLNPLFTTVVFTFVFGTVAKIPTDGLPPFLFYLCGTSCWGYFSHCLLGSSNIFINNAALFGKVYFPRLTVPLSLLLSLGLKFLIQLAIFAAFYISFVLYGAQVAPNLWVLTIPLLALQTGILGMAVGLIVSSVTTKYTDLRHFLGYGVQLWMFATPIVYPLSQVPEQFRWIYALNPMAAVVEGFRFGLLGVGSVTASEMALSIAITFIILVLGVTMFRKMEARFLDWV